MCVKIQDLAIRCIQKNINKNRGVKDWPWWKLFTTVQPLIKVQLTEDQMRSKDVSRPFSVVHPGVIDSSQSATAERGTSCYSFLIILVILNTSQFVPVILHVTYVAMLCAPGGDPAAEIEAGEGGEGAK